jgi:hypothetical protein
MKVWIVLSCPVDDVNVDKVFLSEAKAREYSDAQNKLFESLFEVEGHDVEDAEV